MVPDVGFWWNFQSNFIGLIHVIWHHLQVRQEHPCPPRLKEGTWRTSKVMTGFLMLESEEIFTATKHVWYMSYDTISRFVRNLHVLQDSRKGLGGWIESLLGSWCWILMKFSANKYDWKFNQELQEGKMESWEGKFMFYYDKTFTELSFHLRPSLNHWEPPSPPWL